MELSGLRNLIGSQQLQWQAADTAFSQMPDLQKLARLGAAPPAGAVSLEEREHAAATRVAEAVAANVPTAVDWRNQNGDWITPVEDQGGCGSCVAFAAVATFESHVRIARGDANFAIDLSEADLWFCYGPSHGAGKCPSGGWWPDSALPGLVTGITDAACFAYTDADQACNLCADNQTRRWGITAWHSISTTASMKAYLASTGPLQTCFTVYDDFYNYTSGVYAPANSPDNKVVGGHSVSVIGYDDTGGFWICKNSWGTGFGENGFFCIEYGKCGIDAEMWVIDGVAFHRQWLEALYADLLGRAPDPAGWAYWIQYLIAGHGLPAVAGDFLSSAEYSTDTITGLYQQLLSRAPDPGGLAYWVAIMEQSTPLQQIILGFCNSNEYQANNPLPAAFVESLYERLLGRPSDPGGKQYWINALAAHGTTYVINGFLHSQEYATDRMTHLYNTLLGRAPDPGGLAYWVNQMTAGTSFQQLQSGFLTSAEYQQRALDRFT